MTEIDAQTIRAKAERTIERTRRLETLRHDLEKAMKLQERMTKTKMVNALIQAGDLRITVRVNIGMAIAQIENDIRATTLLLRDATP